MNTDSLRHISYFEESQDRFTRIGITEEILSNAIKMGLRDRNQVSDLYPVTTKGLRTWEGVIAGLRGGLLGLSEFDWTKDHKKGLSITSSKLANLTLVVTSGDKATGVVEKTAKTKNAKGPSTIEFVGRNGDLFEGFDNNVENIKADPNETWVLLYFVDNAKNEVRYELSLPINLHSIDGKLKIDEWEKRVIFNPVPFSVAFDNVVAPDYSDEIDFSDLAIE
jgi:hypothetical protein